MTREAVPGGALGRARLAFCAALGAAGAWSAAEALQLFLAQSRQLGKGLGLWYWPLAVAILAGGLAGAALAVGGALRAVRGGGARWRRIRGALALATLGWLLIVFEALPLRRVGVLGAAAIGTGVWIAGGPLLARLRAGRAGRALLAIDFLAWNAVVLLVVGELVLRGVAAGSARPLFDTDQQSPAERVAGKRNPAGKLRYGFPTNSRGYEDEEFVRREGHPVVVGIADSFGYGVVPRPYHYSQVCERLLGGTAFFNIGIPAIGPDEYLHLLQHEALALDPDAVVVFLFVGNDLVDLDRGRKLESGWRAWFDRERFLVLSLPRRAVLLARELARGRRAGEPQGVAAVPEATAGGDLTAEFPWLEDPELEEATFLLRSYLTMEGTRALRACCASPQLEERFHRRLDDLLEAAGEVPLYFVVIPDEFQVEDPLWKMLSKLPAVREAAPERDRPQEMIGEWARRRGAEVLDLLPLLRAVPPMEDGLRHLYHRCDTHFNARGNRVAGEALAAFLRARGLAGD